MITHYCSKALDNIFGSTFIGAIVSTSNLRTFYESKMDFFSFRFWILTFLVASICAVNGTPEEDQFFADFVQIAMRNYSSWLKASKLDPTPVITVPANMTYQGVSYNTSGEITNQVIYNHSMIGAQVVEASLDHASFNVAFDIPQSQLIGEYWITGNLDDIEISGSGKSSIVTVPALGFDPLLHVSFENYFITAEGFLNLSSAKRYVNFLTDFKGEFENLSAGGEESFMSRMLASSVYPLSLYDWLPLGQYVQSFLEDVFAKTTYADIISGRGIP